MLIPASRFSTLPEGCPVRFRSANLPGTVREPIANAAPMPGGVRDSTLVGPAHLDVDLTTPAAVRAFAPELIAAVRGLPDRLRPLKEPYPVWDAEYGRWILVDYLGDESDNWHGIAYQPGPEEVSGPTPAACLLAGLKAALDAAGGAS